MRKELICLASGDKLYVVRTKTSLKDYSKIAYANNVEDIVKELVNQGIRHNVYSFDGGGKVCNFYLSQSFGDFMNERKIHVINRLDRGCKITFSDRYVSDKEEHKYSDVLIDSNSDEKREFEIYCQSNKYKCMELSIRRSSYNANLEYKTVETIDVSGKYKIAA